MSKFVKSEFVPIIVDVRLAQAESAFKSWLVERGLADSDIPKGDVAQEISRLINGGTGCTYFVRRSRLLQLLKSGRLNKPSSQTNGAFAQPAKMYSTVRIRTHRFESQGAPAGTIAWIVDRDLDETEDNLYR